MSNFEETDVERDFDCLFMIAKCFEAQNLAKEAFKSYNKALRICTTDAVVLCSLGVMLYKYKYVTIFALKTHIIAWKAHKIPSPPLSRFLDFICWINHWLATTAFSEIRWNSFNNNNLLVLRKPQEAFNLFQQSYQLDPSLLESLYNMGIIYENCKFYTEALFIYNKLLQINPDDSFVLRKKSTLEHGKLEANDE